MVGRARHANVKQTPFLGERVVTGAEAQRQDTVLQSDDEYHAEFQPLGGMQREQRDAVALLSPTSAAPSMSCRPGRAGAVPVLSERNAGARQGLGQRGRCASVR